MFARAIDEVLERVDILIALRKAPEITSSGEVDDLSCLLSSGRQTPCHIILTTSYRRETT